MEFILSLLYHKTALYSPSMKIIFIGDIVGKPGRQALAKVLPEWKRKLKPDLVIANGENMAHGIGLTQSTVDEVLAAGVDFITSGDHWADKGGAQILFSEDKRPLVRPANWVGNVAGVGYKIIEVGARPIAIVNLLGQVFVNRDCDSPFHKFDEVVKEIGAQAKIIIVDFHAEATSEKRAFGFYADGRASAVLGTHTHVPTADNQILPQGTGYVSDVGMAGAADSVIGVDKKNIIARFLDQLPRQQEMPAPAAAQTNAIVLEIDDKSGKCELIERLDEEVEL